MFALATLLLVISTTTAYHPWRFCSRHARCWPTRGQWEALNASVGGALVYPTSPVHACVNGSVPEPERCAQCEGQLVSGRNAQWLASWPDGGATTTLGWYGAWEARVAAYAVVARCVQDVVNAVAFCARTGVRLVVKGSGHDYLGRSTGDGSSLVLVTKGLNEVAFEHMADGTIALRVGAGVEWNRVYDAAQRKGRFVLGGGCPTVGAVGGFALGGGFGQLSKQYGTAAANMLQATVVLADGSVVNASESENSELFWGLRGGGGGTFGVVTSMWYRTFEFPRLFGNVEGTLTASSPATFQALLQAFFEFARTALLVPQWGDQVEFSTLSMTLGMAFVGLNETEAATTWRPFLTWVQSQGDAYTWTSPFAITMTASVPGGWAKMYPPAGCDWNGGDFWCPGTETPRWWLSYSSRYLMTAQLADAPTLAHNMTQILAAGLGLLVRFNNGQAGADWAARNRTLRTSMHPAVLDAAALVLFSVAVPEFWPAAAPLTTTCPALPNGDWSGIARVIAQHGPPAEACVADPSFGACWNVTRDWLAGYAAKTCALFEAMFASSYPYVNEANYHLGSGWQTELWGANYPRLLRLKQQVDPKGVFWCHHCVGSEL